MLAHSSQIRVRNHACKVARRDRCLQGDLCDEFCDALPDIRHDTVLCEGLPPDSLSIQALLRCGDRDKEYLVNLASSSFFRKVERGRLDDGLLFDLDTEDEVCSIVDSHIESAWTIDRCEGDFVVSDIEQRSHQCLASTTSFRIVANEYREDFDQGVETPG